MYTTLKPFIKTIYSHIEHLLHANGIWHVMQSGVVHSMAPLHHLINDLVAILQPSTMQHKIFK